MLERDIKDLGEAVYRGKISKYVGKGKSADRAFCGIDTEYDSRTHRLICVSIWMPEGSDIWKADTLDPLDVRSRIEKILGRSPEEIIALNWFYAAETQHIPSTAFDWTRLAEYGTAYDFALSEDIWLVDISRYFASEKSRALKYVAKKFGLEKLDYDTEHVTPSCWNDPKFRDYAVNDSRIVYKIFEIIRERFAKATGVDLFQAKTLAGLASRYYRSGLDHHIVSTDAPGRHEALLSYWGGRSEALYRGVFSKQVELDRKSAYPNSVVHLAKLPVGIKQVSANEFLDAPMGWCRASFEFPADTQYPCLPVGSETMLWFPLRGVTHCTLAEIRVALLIGCQVKFLKCYIGSEYDDTFVEFMRKCITKREETRGTDMEFVWKTLANSSYGKLIQHVNAISIKRLARLCVKEGCTITDYYRLSRGQQHVIEAQHNYSVRKVQLGAMFCPEWACLISGQTRAWLAEGLLKAHKPKYTSTDSIWCDEGSDLGSEWDIKEEGVAIVARTRLGSIGNHLASHSIWRKDEAQKILNQFSNGDFKPHEYSVNRARKVKECLRMGIPIGTWVDGEMHTGDSRWDGKRILNSDGTTRPVLEIA